MVVFAGGMPRASYGERNTVTVRRAKDAPKEVVFDFSSRVVDFFAVDMFDSDSGMCGDTCLII